MEINNCTECGEPEEMPPGHLCRVCWEFENDPESFTLTKEQDQEMKECAAYIAKHNLTPSLDGDVF